ncbi:50S ribosomal protein L24 [Candidatus Peribacteria bacterium]|jgi:large subunit ribosomal protein L24|nr:50S ribosomal protein L24 [Candidatus Peribacteria bacterium]MBT4021378.1 50S ribosomal protein L24 [Candidatus Peribacteria bacterium]MBT4240550.1 50S ribosomal protein L24 [Candidatus Peribacteria bacterium]MBT4474398.1 50S ribosomal protein L24 [Candidatus Peribacteria bacterium]
MKFHTGDNVVVIAGKDKGKTGRILRVLSSTNRLVVAGINMRTKHMKKSQQSPGRKVSYEASLNASNVMLLDPKTKKRSRMGSRFDSAGKKERFAKNSGEALVSGKKLKKLIEDEGKDGKDSKEEKDEKGESTKKKKKKAPASKKSKS